jgi:nucleoside 2-deoxyribosyltransferase
MRLYLACTVRGNRDAVASARALAARLERHGHEVLTTHLLADDVDAQEASLDDRAVFDRDIRWLDACDALVAEASGSSYGVGFEVGYILGRAPETGQRAYVLYQAARRGSISRLISGARHPHCTTLEYRNAAEILRFVDEHLGPDRRP